MITYKYGRSILGEDIFPVNVPSPPNQRTKQIRIRPRDRPLRQRRHPEYPQHNTGDYPIGRTNQ
jgi:hypothetical protein